MSFKRNILDLRKRKKEAQLGGGEKAIEESYLALARTRRGDPALPELTVAQIREQMPLAVARVMTEGSLYDRDLAALAIKQASGDLMEAIFLNPFLKVEMLIS